MHLTAELPLRSIPVPNTVPYRRQAMLQLCRQTLSGCRQRMRLSPAMAAAQLQHTETCESPAPETSLHSGVLVDAPASTSGRPKQERKDAPHTGVADLSQAQLQRNRALVERLRGKLILAPLTKGGNLPFRRLCADFGAEATMSEMSFARHLLRGAPHEKARLKRAANEQCFGFQFATNNIGEGVGAARLAADSGASWVDLNCGCPIHEATKRGLGSALLRSPRKLARLVAGIAEGSPLPLTVKVRLGTSASKINVAEVTELLEGAGAAAVIIHGRTAEQRYKKPADWGLLGDVARANSVPVIGNGDIMTHFEVRRRLADSGCLAQMAGRGALIRPWLFQEAREGREVELSARDRVGVYRRLVSHMKEHFGDDAMGRRKAFYFLPWHFDFFCRYRPLPEDIYGPQSLERPLIGQRTEIAVAELGEELDSLPVLERLLRCQSPEAHAEIAAVLWDSGSDDEAAAALAALGDASVQGWEAALRDSGAREDQVAEG